MKKKISILAIVFALFSVFALTNSASAWWLEGTVSLIENHSTAGAWGAAGIYITVDTGAYTTRRPLAAAMTDGVKKEILAMVLTAQVETATVRFWVTGSPQAIVSMEY